MVPKNHHWTVHFNYTTVDLGPMYHNPPFTLHRDVAIDYMFSNFAWTIFPFVRDFPEQGFSRHVRLYTVDGLIKEETLGADTMEERWIDSKTEQRGRKRRRLYPAGEGGWGMESLETERVPGSGLPARNLWPAMNQRHHLRQSVQTSQLWVKNSYHRLPPPSTTTLMAVTRRQTATSRYYRQSPKG